MSVYVHRTLMPGNRGGVRKGWWRMVADTPAELRAMLGALDLNPSYIDGAGGKMEGFPLTPSAKKTAVSLGARVLSDEDAKERHAKLFESQYGHRPGEG